MSTPATPDAQRRLRWAFLGRTPYPESVALQERVRANVKYGTGDEHLLLLEHEPVFTLGRNASADDIVADPNWLARHQVAVHETNRGGKVTYHGPGQLVGYPILDLNPDRRDIRRYVHDLQTVLIRTLDDCGVAGWRRDGRDHIGVWTGSDAHPMKIASIGVHLSRWVTMHGFALNVATDLDRFAGIVACGLPTVTMTSIAEQADRTPTLEAVADRIATHAAAVFERQLMAGIADAPARRRSTT